MVVVVRRQRHRADNCGHEVCIDRRAGRRVVLAHRAVGKIGHKEVVVDIERHSMVVDEARDEIWVDCRSGDGVVFAHGACADVGNQQDLPGLGGTSPEGRDESDEQGNTRSPAEPVAPPNPDADSSRGGEQQQRRWLWHRRQHPPRVVEARGERREYVTGRGDISTGTSESAVVPLPNCPFPLKPRQRAVRVGQGQAVFVTRRYLSDEQAGQRPVHRHGRGTGSGRTIAELAVEIAPPGVGDPVLHRQAVVGRADGGDAGTQPSRPPLPRRSRSSCRCRVGR